MSKSAAIKTLLLGVFFSFLGAGVWGQEVLYGPETFGDGSSINAGLGTWSSSSQSAWTAENSIGGSGYTLSSGETASGAGSLRANLSNGNSSMILKPIGGVPTINITNVQLELAIYSTTNRPIYVEV
ncbi:MAG: hypothetical protein ACOCXH_14840, partial [Cyclobacteriaceae bacterium]